MPSVVGQLARQRAADEVALPFLQVRGQGRRAERARLSVPGSTPNSEPERRMINANAEGEERASGLPRLRGVAAEVEGVPALGREVDFRDEAGLAEGLGPRLPTLGAAGGGDGVVGGTVGVVDGAWIPDVPAGGGDDGERLAVDPFEEERGVDGDMGLERRGEIEGAVADTAGCAGRRSGGRGRR